jgi:hypothetical protein
MWGFRILKDLCLVRYINPIKMSMSRKLQMIRDKMEAIRHGLLRFSEGSTRQSMEVKALMKDDTGISCILSDDGHKTSLLNREVNLIQKDADDYLYISGKVDDEIRQKDKMISLRIIKAFWFTRRKKGSAVWLQEKFTYDKDDFEKAS